jgi:hypothetical protein
MTLLLLLAWSHEREPSRLPVEPPRVNAPSNQIHSRIASSKFQIAKGR